MNMFLICVFLYLLLKPTTGTGAAVAVGAVHPVSNSGIKERVGYKSVSMTYV